MLMAEIVELIDTLRRSGEDGGVEAKSAVGGVPAHMAESVCAFANSPGGGVLLLGVDERAGFTVEGVADPHKLQQDVVGVCRDGLEPPLAPEVTVATIDGRDVVVVAVPELPRAEKPCYVRSKGINRGSYLRVANSARRLTTEEVQQVVADRGQPRFDRVLVEDAVLGDLEPGMVSAYLARLRSGQPHLFGTLDDLDALNMTNVVGRDASGEPRPTVAGLLAMAHYPQRFFPQLNVTFVHYSTPDGISDVEGLRFLDNVRVDGPIPVMVRDSAAALLRNMSRRAVITAQGRRDKWEYPPDALRELIVNALVHRDLSPGSRGTQVQVELYPDRMRILNPGGLFGAVDVDHLGEEGVTSTRNADLLRILEDVVVPGENRAVCENRGSGVRIARAVVAESGLPAPTFRDKVTAFEVVLRAAIHDGSSEHHGGTAPSATRPSTTDGRTNRRDQLLGVLRARGEASRAEIAADLGLTQKNASYWLSKLRADGSIEPTEDVRSPHVRYRIRPSSQT